MTAPNRGEQTTLTCFWCASNVASGAVESSFLGGRRPVSIAAIFMPGIRACAPMAGRRVSATPRGCPRQLSNAPATRAAVESLSRGACNATLEAPMATIGRDELHRCALAERHAP